MARSALPQNYELSPGTLVDSLDSLTGWTKSANGTMELDTTHFSEGSASIKLSSTAGSQNVYAQKTVSLDISNVGSICIDTFVDGDSALSSSGIYLYLYSGANYLYASRQNEQDGWGRHKFRRSDFTSSGGATWNDTVTKIRIAQTSNAGKLSYVSFDNLRFDVNTPAVAVLSFDDQYPCIIENAFPIMEARGIKGTMYVNPTTVDHVTHMTTAQLQTLYDAGWAICNHSTEHLNLTTLSASEVRRVVGEGYDWLIDNDMPRAAKHFAYPFGACDAATLATMETIPEVVTGRMTSGSHKYYFGDCLTFKRYFATSTLNQESTLPWATLMSDMEGARLRGAVAFPYGHYVDDPEADQTISIAKFTTFCDYLKNYFICKTVDEWYEGLTNPRYRSLPVGRSAL